MGINVIYHHHNCMELELNGYFIGVSEVKGVVSEWLKAFSSVYIYIYIYIFFFVIFSVATKCNKCVVLIGEYNTQNKNCSFTSIHIHTYIYIFIHRSIIRTSQIEC